MNIIFVTDCLKNGGAEREIAAFANIFVKLEQSIHILCVDDLESDYPLDPQIGLHRLALVSRVKLRKLRVPFRWRNAIRQLQSLHPDIILSVNLSLKYYPVLWLTSCFSKGKLLYAGRNNLEKKYPEERDRKKWKRAAYLADGIWIQTDGQRHFFPASYEKKIFVVPNILEPKFLRIQRTQRDEICRFISVGRLHPQKNQKLLIEAFVRMLEKTKKQNVTLTIFGQQMPWDSPVEEEIKALIHAYQLEKRVFLPGRTREIEKCYEEADAFVFASDYEGLPNALMEAMAAGLPCISTDCPTGPSSLIINGENGILVPVGDVEAMAKAMGSFVEHPQFACRMGELARKRMQSWESNEQLAGRMLEYFRRICG